MKKVQIKKNKILYLAIDFDECLIQEHLSMNFTKFYIEKYKLAALDFAHDRKSINDIVKIYEGAKYEDLISIANQCSKGVKWRKNAEKFIRHCSNHYSIQLTIISSGLDIPIKQFLNLNEIDIPVFSCSLSFLENICLGAKKTVSDVDKKIFIETAIKKYGHKNVISIGHSLGDLNMMQSSQSICIPKGVDECEKTSCFSSNDFEEIIFWLNENNPNRRVKEIVKGV